MRLFLLLCLLFAALFSAVALQGSNSEVTASENLLEKVQQHEWVLVDVRSKEEFEQGHIPGAINLPHDNSQAMIARLNEFRDKPIVVYCRSGRRAKLAMEYLKEASFNDVRHLEGDMMGWHDAGFAVDRM